MWEGKDFVSDEKIHLGIIVSYCPMLSMFAPAHREKCSSSNKGCCKKILLGVGRFCYLWEEFIRVEKILQEARIFCGNLCFVRRSIWHTSHASFRARYASNGVRRIYVLGAGCYPGNQTFLMHQPKIAPMTKISGCPCNIGCACGKITCIMHGTNATCFQMYSLYFCRA